LTVCFAQPPAIIHLFVLESLNVLEDDGEQRSVIDPCSEGLNAVKQEKTF